jgi:hypothetical protein
VPTGKIRYDNLKAAVANVIGFSRQRVKADRWTAFRSHDFLANTTRGAVLETRSGLGALLLEAELLLADLGLDGLLAF